MANGPNGASTDYYAILGVAANASDAEIEKAYNKLVRELHPDNFDAGDDEGTSERATRMEKVNEAYTTLSRSRDEYDARRLRGSVAHKPRPKKFSSEVANWTSKDSDEWARLIREGRYAGEFVILQDRFEIMDVSGERDGNPFREPALCIDGFVLEEIDGDVTSHEFADDEQHRAFAEQVDDVDLAFADLEETRDRAQETIHKIGALLYENSTVWAGHNGEVQYRLEAVQSDSGSRIVLTRAGRIMSEVGPILDRRRRGCLSDYQAFAQEAAAAEEQARAIRQILADADSKYALYDTEAGDQVEVGGASYGVFTIECSAKAQSGGSYSAEYTQPTKPTVFMRPPGTLEPDGSMLPEPEASKIAELRRARVASAGRSPQDKSKIFYANVLCRKERDSDEWRPLRLTDKEPIDPNLRGFDIRDLEAWLKDKQQVRRALENRTRQRAAERASQYAKYKVDLEAFWAQQRAERRAGRGDPQIKDHVCEVLGI